MPNCKRCHKPLNDDEFYLCSECESEGLYQEFIEEKEETEEDIDEKY